jgi:RimJ/RimL family protein N-acetyltransferase
LSGPLIGHDVPQEAAQKTVAAVLELFRATLEQTGAAIRRWIDARDAGGPMFAYALRQPSRLLTGGCKIRLLPPDRAKISHWIFPEFRDRGYATRALALLWENEARIQGIKQLEARIDTDNMASR